MNERGATRDQTLRCAQSDSGALVARFPELRLAGGALEWRTVPGFRGLLRLPVLI